MNQRKNKVNTGMDATTEKATQGTATSSTGTVRKVTPPTLAQQWEALADRFEGYAIELSEEGCAQIALEIRRGVRDGLDLPRLAGAAARIHEDAFGLVKLVTETSPFAEQVKTAMDDSACAVHLLHETAFAAAKNPATPTAAPAAPVESNVELLLRCVDRLTALDCNEGDPWRAKPLRSALVTAAHCLTTEREIGIGHGSRRAGLVALARHVARVFERQATRFEGADDKARAAVAEELFVFAGILSEISRRVRDAQTVEVSR